MVAWLREKDPVKAGMLEATLAAAQLLRFCDALILHSTETWALLPLLTLRQNIYTDPRTPISVEPGLREIGRPDEASPVLLTSNFALTYYTVEGDLESSKVSCYLLVVDTEGLAVEAAMAGDKLTADGVKEALEASKVAEKVKHRKLIIPGRAARISGEIEEATGWEVLVGPIDSSRIGGYLEEKWGK
jgi:acetyl-CoA decarbonylase/synthase complex subunit gamma